MPTKPKSKAKARRPPVLVAPELTQPVLSAGRLRTKLSQHLGDARALNGACKRAVAELVDGSMDEAVILRGTMWLYERTEGDAVTIAEARAAEMETKYQALVGDVQALFEASRQPAGRIAARRASAAADIDVEADADVDTAETETAEEDKAADASPAGIPPDPAADGEALELQAELLGYAEAAAAPPAPATPAPAAGRWVYDARTGMNRYVVNPARSK